jgi:lipoate-protein ligase A
MTEHWRLLNLHGLPGRESQTIYHTVSKAMEKYDDIPNTIILCWPENPIVCVGYHQIISEEVNVEYCQKKGIPIVRRCLGGGTVYLDSDQLFYQVISRLDSKIIPKKVAKLYEFLLQAPINTYRTIGIPAEYAPINDIVAEEKKISGNGTAMLNGGRILTGNLIIDFNVDEMVQILKVPSEKFRDKVAKSLNERMGTMKLFLEEIPSRDKLTQLLIADFQKILKIEFDIDHKLTPKEQTINRELLEFYQSDEWLNLPLQRHQKLASKRKVKISSSNQIYESVYKASGGLIRLFIEIRKERISELLLSGDFSSHPMNAPELIENELVGQPLKEETILNRLQEIYQENDLDLPGIEPADITRAIMLTTKDSI